MGRRYIALEKWLAMIRILVSRYCWIHEVLIGSLLTLCQSFVMGSTGRVVQGHVNKPLLQEPGQVLCRTWWKYENGSCTRRLAWNFPSPWMRHGWDLLAEKVSHLNGRAGEFLCPSPRTTLTSISILPLWPLRQDFLLQLNSKCFLNSSSLCKETLKIDYFLFVSFSLQMFLPL